MGVQGWKGYIYTVHVAYIYICIYIYILYLFTSVSQYDINSQHFVVDSGDASFLRHTQLLLAVSSTLLIVNSCFKET